MTMMRACARRLPSCAAIVLLNVLGSACTGAIESSPRMDPFGPGDPIAGNGSAGAAGSSGTSGAAGGAGTPGGGAMLLPAATLRRLTPAQYQNSVRDLLGITPDVSSLSAIPPLNGLQAIGASTVSLAEVDLEAFERIADESAARVFNDTTARMRIAGCDATASACGPTFIASFGKRAFRRPLTTDELGRYGALLDNATSMTGDAWLGLRVVTSAFLQSPSFLYREELGAPDPAGAPQRQLNAFELASRVAFFLTDTLPDPALLDAAESGALADNASLRVQVERLMASSTAGAATEQLFGDYLRLDALDGLVKLSDVYPAATPTLAHAMKEETLLTLRDLLFTRSGDFRDAFTSHSTFVNEELANLYDLDDAPRGDALAPIELPASGPRAGLLTQASFLALHAHPGRTSPTKRGKFIRESLLCQAVPAPPPNVDTSLPDTSDARTLREKLTEHRENPACAGCHTLMDPIGLSLEHFDGIGAFRTTENGVAIDASGELDGATFDGARGLAEALAASPALTGCFARTLLRYARGALETSSETPTIAELEAAFASAGYKVPELMAHIASAPAFQTVGALP